MLKDIQGKLDIVYKQYLDKEYLEKKFTLPLDNFSAPFLIKVDENYVKAQPKILFIGKETNKWWGSLQNFIDKDNGIEILEQRYEAEMFGGKVEKSSSSDKKSYKAEAGWKNSFFVEFKKIRKALSDDIHGSIIWTNLLKIDDKTQKGYSKNSKKYPEVRDISKSILNKEIDILKPDFIIFATSYTYDDVIKEFFEYETIEVIEKKSLWKFKLGNTICYRTWHPSTIKYKSEKNKLEYYKDIISDIKSIQDSCD